MHSAWERVEVAKNKASYPVIVSGIVTSYTWTDLKAFTDYRVTVVACNKLELDQDTSDSTHIVCGMDYPANKTFKTLVGRPGQPNELKYRNQNSSVVKLMWDRGFQVGQHRGQFSLLRFSTSLELLRLCTGKSPSAVWSRQRHRM